jgi:hypothetical protein
MTRTVVGLIALFVFFAYCESAPEKAEREGRSLAEKHCITCHDYPDPGLVDKKTWVLHVLPKMGGLLGFRHFEGINYFENDYAKATMSLQEWNKIVRFYVNKAPDSPYGHSNVAAIDTTLSLFRPVIPSFRIQPPLSSYAGISRSGNSIYFADGITQQLYTMKNGGVVDSIQIGTGVSQVVQNAEGLMVLAMGVMHPSDVISGKLVHVQGSESTVILDSLQRPVYAEFADLNEDDNTDIILCEFGNNVGKLSWFEKKTDGSYSKHILKNLPGAVKTATRDFNDDRRPDVMALMAQADEGIFIFFNEGGGKFREQRLLRFSPAYGCNYFELVDINNDNYLDILVTNGDNGDYPPVLKSYHGIRIYLNDGRNNFTEKLFLPVNGANKVVARDFDMDGDKDMASIAYFPDYKHRPYESFIYWENKGNMQFAPHSFPEALRGRWLVMDAGDPDRDGDEDIILGSARMAMGSVPDTLLSKWDESSPSVLILENLSVRF